MVKCRRHRPGSPATWACELGVAAGGRQVDRADGRTWGRRSSAGHHPAAALQRRHDRNPSFASRRRGFGFDHADHAFQLMAAILHRRRADDRADLRRRKIECDELADVRKLDEQHIILADPAATSAPRADRSPPSARHRSTAADRRKRSRAIGSSTSASPIRWAAALAANRSAKVDRPTSHFRDSAAFVLSATIIVRRPARCSDPCRCHRRSPNVVCCPNRCARAG